MPLVLETPRLTGRPPRADEVPAMLALYGLPEVAERLNPDRGPPTEAEVAVQLEADVAHWRAHGFGRFLWEERGSGEVVARCGPKLAIVGGRPEIDLHWAVRVDRHRRGLALEAGEAVVRACFAALATDSVTAMVRFDNTPSHAVATRLGFAYERDAEHFGAPHRVYRRRRPG
jgi:RimJ/RimL family protein N-acetyltransferase